MKINKGQFQLSSKRDTLKFHIRRGKGHIFFYVINRFKWHWFPRLGIVPDYPLHMDIEVSTLCNLNCPMCYRRIKEFDENVPKCTMDFKLFKKIIDEIAGHVYSIRLSLRGEAFLNKDISKMTTYAKNAGIKEVASLTNMHAIKKEDIQKLVDSGLDWLSVSIDGIGKTYERIRKPAKFSETFEKIKLLHKIKKEKGKVKPVVSIQSIFPAIKDTAEEYVRLLSPYVDKLASNPLIDYLIKSEDIVYEKNFSCPTIYQRLVIGSDGKFLMCVNDEFGRHVIGDAKRNGVYEIWHSREMKKLRKAHKEHIAVGKYEPCKKCFYSRATRREKIAGYNVDGYVVKECGKNVSK